MDAHDELREFAKGLRRRMSLPEVLPWRAIKGRKLAGMHFRTILGFIEQNPPPSGEVAQRAGGG